MACFGECKYKKKWYIIHPNCKKGCGPPKSLDEKRCEIQVGSQEMAVMVRKWQFFLIMTIQLNFCQALGKFGRGSTNSPELY